MKKGEKSGMRGGGAGEEEEVVVVEEVEVEVEEEEEEERATQRIAALRVTCVASPSFHRLHFRNRIPVLATLYIPP